MNMNDLKIKSSIKYEFKGSKKYNISPLYLKGMFSVLNSPKSGKPSYFFGFINGSNQLQKLKIYFVRTDKDVVEKTPKYLFNNKLDVVYLNILNLTYTRFPLKISNYLRDVCTKFSISYEKEIKILKLKEEMEKDLLEYNKAYSKTSDIVSKELEVDNKQFTALEYLSEMKKYLLDSWLVDLNDCNNNLFILNKIYYVQTSFHGLPKGFSGGRMFNGETYIEHTGDTKKLMIAHFNDYVKAFNSNPYSRPDYIVKKANLFKELSYLSSIELEKLNNVEITFYATFTPHLSNDETADISITLDIRFKKYDENTVREFKYLVDKYKNPINMDF